MGLDMEIIRVRKSNYDSNVVYDRSNVNGIILGVDFESYEDTKQLAPYASPLKVRSSEIDFAKISKEYGFGEDVHIGEFSLVSMEVIDDASGKKVTISNDEVREKYTVEKFEDRFVCAAETVRSWGKRYDIQNFFHENLGCHVENTGMYMISEELLEEFNAAFPEFALVDEEGSGLFYWEWY